MVCGLKNGNHQEISRVGAMLAAGLFTAGPASAQTGGAAAPGSVPPAPSTTVPGAKAKVLKNGKAVAPAGAPPRSSP